MASTTKPARRFSHVRLENWRNFKTVEVDLQKRVFLYGPNASGKSNFLDVFRFLREIVLDGGGFVHAVEQRGGVSKLRCLSARRYPEIGVKVRVATNGDGVIWEYGLRFTQDNQRRSVIKQERIVKDGKEILRRPNCDDKRDPEQLRQTHLEQVLVNREFRELADFFRSVSYFHIVPQLVRDPEKYRGRANDPFGWDLLSRISGTPEKTRNAWLRRIREALKATVSQLNDLELMTDRRGVPHLRGRFEHWRPQGAWQTEEMFSDGTLRLLGLLWATLEGAGPLLLEEPELSLHTEIVRQIPALLARMQSRTGRQVLVSSHSPELLSDTGVALDEVLLLEPSAEGTTLRRAAGVKEIQKLHECGISLAEAVSARTRPEGADQLPLFGHG